MLAVAQSFPSSSSPTTTTDVHHRTRPSSRTSSNLASTSNNRAFQSRQSATPSQSQGTTIKAPSTPPPTTPIIPDNFDLHSYPPNDLLKLLATLLTHIATTNDHISSSSSSSTQHTTIPPLTDPGPDTPPIWRSLTSASRTAVSTPAATLTFHARNVPTITLEAYLLRILKYCPTTNHVFLSLLVYFDRMSKLSDDAVGRAFVIDSYNIHRLVIAGVTVASKFFSDVFYTNSRYAKVGGLPLPELNQLELQFLLLNDFRLVISSSEMQYYAEQLIRFSKSHATGSGQPLSLPHPSTFSVNGHSTPATNGTASTPAGVVSPSPSDGSNSSSSGSSTTTVTGHHQQGFSSSSFSTQTPTRPIDALGGVPAPTHNPMHHPSWMPHTHPPHSGQHSHPHHQFTFGTTQPSLYPASVQPHFQYPTSAPAPVSASSSISVFSHPLSSASSSVSSFKERESDVSGEYEGEDDNDTSTDAGTETDSVTDAGTEDSVTDAGSSETDEEPTIRGPRTVGGGSVYGGEGARREVSEFGDGMQGTRTPGVDKPWRSTDERMVTP
ncbi:hypothetical protein CVT24_007621 [Panaeolus cyanescens]|uniref:Cyclin-domain-containing protein n=1 Tax=Panaeolus cyanescens TaxID=181874 RepID=A0A409W555_9AGAR|nr:hypothetical protein CVT24_007621 [Panaeolus cyanescens]